MLCRELTFPGKIPAPALQPKALFGPYSRQIMHSAIIRAQIGRLDWRRRKMLRKE
jgi:hypothetical protein